MIPTLHDSKRIAATIVSNAGKDGEDISDEQAGKQQACQEMMTAIEKKDPQAFGEALDAYLELRGDGDGDEEGDEEPASALSNGG